MAINSKGNESKSPLKRQSFSNRPAGSVFFIRTEGLGASAEAVDGQFASRDEYVDVSRPVLISSAAIGEWV